MGSSDGDSHEESKRFHHSNNPVESAEESLSTALTHRVQHLQALQQLQEPPPHPSSSVGAHNFLSDESILLREEVQRQQLLLLQEQRRRQLEEQQYLASMAATGGGGADYASLHHQQQQQQLHDSLLHQQLFQLKQQQEAQSTLAASQQLPSASMSARQQLLLHQQTQDRGSLMLPNFADGVLSDSTAASLQLQQQPSQASLELMLGLQQQNPMSPRRSSSSNLFASSSNYDPLTALVADYASNSATTGVGSIRSGHSRRKERPQREKNKPKRPLSAYNIFFREERARILKEIPTATTGTTTEGATATSPTTEETPESDTPASSNKKRSRKAGHGKISFENLAKVIGQRWQDLRPDQIVYYKEKASVDLKRYQREMKAYNNKDDATGTDDRKQPARNDATVAGAPSSKDDKIGGDD